MDVVGGPHAAGRRLPGTALDRPITCRVGFPNVSKGQTTEVH